MTATTTQTTDTQTTVINHIAPWLTLDGLKIVWDLNHR